jgi:hypothetical protein
MNLDPYTAGPLKEVVELVSILMRPPRSCHLLIKSPCLVEKQNSLLFVCVCAWLCVGVWVFVNFTLVNVCVPSFCVACSGGLWGLLGVPFRPIGAPFRCRDRTGSVTGLFST